MARTSDFSQETADLICARMAEGMSLRSICQADDMPDKSTVFRWLAAREEFRDQYARAMDTRADAFAEEIIEISDDSSGDAIEDPETGAVRMNTEFVARSRLKVDTRKWLMARMAPKKYGDKIEQTHNGGDKPIETVQRLELVAAPFPPDHPAFAEGEGGS